MENVVVSNQNYIVSPLTLGDLKAFRVWVQYLDWLNFQELKGTLPDEIFQAESQRIRLECTKRKLTEGDLDLANMMDKAEGIVKLVQLSLAHKQPTLSYRDVAELLRNPEAATLVERVLIVSGLMNTSVIDPTPEKKSDEITALA